MMDRKRLTALSIELGGDDATVIVLNLKTERPFKVSRTAQQTATRLDVLKRRIDVDSDLIFQRVSDAMLEA